ncbi:MULTISPECIES: PAS domain-containing protein [Pseudofrankia]|uniref:PAS domain-containing protein n=1 Tax=Pseudofrankia TaxID=2994363 RepID=UPI0010425042|nr:MULTISPECIES: PAS domain-containing protein [Pseudofrankia]
MSVPDLIDDLKAAEQSSIFEVFAYVPRALELIRRAMDGEPGCDIHEAFGRHYELHIRPIFDPCGEVSQVASISTDVTDREQARFDQSVLANLAHQALRTAEPDRLWNHAAAVLALYLPKSISGLIGTVAADPGPSRCLVPVGGGDCGRIPLRGASTDLPRCHERVRAAAPAASQ